MRLWNGSCRGPEPKICNCNLYVSWSWGSMGQFCKWICPESIRSTANLHHVILQELGIQTRGGIGNLFGSRLWGFSIMVTAWIFLWCYPPDKCYSALVTSSLLYSDLSKENSIAYNDMLLLIQASSFFYHLMLLLLSNERPKQRVCRTTPQCFQAESEPTLVKSGTVSPTLWEAKNSLENGGCELLFVASAEVNQTCIYQTNHSSLKTFFPSSEAERCCRCRKLIYINFELPVHICCQVLQQIILWPSEDATVENIEKTRHEDMKDMIWKVCVYPYSFLFLFLQRGFKLPKPSLWWSLICYYEVIVQPFYVTF